MASRSLKESSFDMLPMNWDQVLPIDMVPIWRGDTRAPVVEEKMQKHSRGVFGSAAGSYTSDVLAVVLQSGAVEWRGLMLREMLSLLLMRMIVLSKGKRYVTRYFGSLLFYLH